MVQLHPYTISRVETAISTEFAESNETYIRRFLVLKQVKGLSERSLKAYEQVIRMFFAFVDKPLQRVTTDDIRYFLAVKRRNGISGTTADNYLRNLRTFFATMHAEDIIQRNPCVKIDAIKRDSQPEDPLTEDEMEDIREACSLLKTDIERLRALALIEVLYSTGCRISEVAGMDREDGARSTYVLGKGNKTREVYFNARCVSALNRYYAVRDDGCKAMFATIRGANRMGAESLESIIRTIGDLSIVDGRVHAHRFRHTTATTALRKGMPIDQVRVMLGHEDLKTTQIYATTDKDQVRESHRKYMG